MRIGVSVKRLPTLMQTMIKNRVQTKLNPKWFLQTAWKVTLTGTDVLFPDNTLPGWLESLAALHSIREPFPLNPASSSRPLYSLPLDSDFPVFQPSTKDSTPANVSNCWK
ncbi:hypothetical protein MIR68_008441 [Amoeboaphelidium protococcarum]|nr:hypothetical protein MIR68_008441 [Amoeboaphelidium protococcarum]